MTSLVPVRCRRGAKTRVFEPERGRPVHPLHECRNEFPVFIIEQVGHRPVDDLARELPLQGIECPVEVHDEEMDAV